MSGNTLPHLAGKKLPAIANEALADFSATAIAPAGDDYAHWQSQANTMSVCVHENKGRAAV